MSSQNFFDKLPPPRFLDIPYFGISVSDKNIRAIRFSKKNGNLDLLKYAERSIPADVVVDGQVEKIEQFAEILKEIKSEFGLNYARISLSEEKAYLFRTKLPVVSKKEIRGAIEANLEENVPVSAADLIFDYSVDEQKISSDNLEVVVVALPKNTIDSYIQSADAAGLSLLSLEIESQAMVKSLLTKNTKTDNIIVYFNSDKMFIYVVRDCIVNFTSSSSIKGNIKDNLPFISQEIRKISAYWKSLDTIDNGEVSSVIICGDYVDESVLSEISLNVKIPVSFGNVWTNVFNINKSVPEIPFKDSLRFAPAVGLALPRDILI